MKPPGDLAALDFPTGSPFEVEHGKRGRMILDPVRRRFVRLTPEEWVRQHLLRTLVEHLDFPPGLIALEAAIRTDGGTRRPDVVAYDGSQQPVLIAECKAPGVTIDQGVFEQVSRYNVVTLAPVLMVTNGHAHYCWRVDREKETCSFLSRIPSYSELTEER